VAQWNAFIDDLAVQAGTPDHVIKDLTAFLLPVAALARKRKKEFERQEMAMATTRKKKKALPRSAGSLSTLDDPLKADGNLEEFVAVAIKEVQAWQLEGMKAGNLSRNRLAQRIGTSRSQVSRLLDLKDGNVTLSTLQRAARIVGRSLPLELV
jgi:antitoxin HicB